MSGRKKVKKWKHPVLESWGEEASPTTPPPTLGLIQPSNDPPPPQTPPTVCSSNTESKDDQKSSEMETVCQEGIQEDENPVRTAEKDVTSIPDRDTVGQDRVEPKTPGSPPPPHRVVKEAGPQKTLLCDRPSLGNVADQIVRSRDSVRSSEEEYIHNKEDISIDDRKTRNITVNGIDLTEYLKMKSKDNRKMTPDRKRKMNKEDKNKKNTTPSSGKNRNTLLKYIVKKKEPSSSSSETTTMKNTTVVQGDIVTGDRGYPDPGVRGTTDHVRNKNVKTTFASIADMKGVSVSDRVRDFSKMKECMISSGYCNYHNVRVKREVSVKKMSTADKNSEVGDG